jgi:alkylated DNA repair dioxygenase AlkB
MKTADAARFVNLGRYPIEDLDSAEYRALVQRCREQFDDAVSCHLPDFLRMDAIDAALREIDQKRNLQHLYIQHRGAYNLEDPRTAKHQTALNPEDVRSMTHRRHQRWIGTDDLSEVCPVKAIYDWPNLTQFVRDVLDVPELYTVDDPLMRVLINVHIQGDELGWHVDSHDYAVTILLRGAKQGGLYQYVPMTGPGDENYEYAAKLFEGDVSRVRTVPMGPGSMVIFRGRNTLHRVTPVVDNSQDRVLALLAYDPVPGRNFGPSFRRNLLNRETPRA